MESMRDRWFYTLDGDNRIIEIGPGWDEFALANDCPAAMVERVLNRPLAEFVAGREVLQLLHELIELARSRGGVRPIGFRCDAPGLQRMMEWRAERGADDEVLVHTRLLGTMPRRRNPILDVALPHADELLSVCSWCKRARLEDDWVDTDEAAARLGVFLRDRPPAITHGICPACTQALESAVPLAEP